MRKNLKRSTLPIIKRRGRKKIPNLTPQYQAKLEEKEDRSIEIADAEILKTIANLNGRLSVANLAEFHKRMVEHKVPCVQEPKDVFGARVAQYLDPDGLVISVGEERGRR